MGNIKLSCLAVLLVASLWAQPALFDSDYGDQPASGEYVDYSSPDIDGQYFFEHFDDQQVFESRWIQSTAYKADSTVVKYDGEWDRFESQALLKGNFTLIPNCSKLFIISLNI